jgi:hypothetical protein
MTERATMEVMGAVEWEERAHRHRERAHVHTREARVRRDRGEPHPIEDFLFQYYPFPFALLEHWHPGVGVALEWRAAAGSPALPAGFSPRWHRIDDGAIFADPAMLGPKERERLVWIRSLLAATAGRAGNFACHGLHEWAMVYRGKDVRHEKTTPLRLPQHQIDTFVESRPIACSHHDAFRFFAEEARPMNRLQPSLDLRVHMEQPACVHANMDLYKWAAKSMPWIGSDLLLDCFELAKELRELDMRASPYDLSRWGRAAIRIETPEGRREYEVLQRDLAARAAPLRQRLVEALDCVA